MSKLNIIQRRELEPLILKADKIAKHYEKALNCTAFVMEHDWDSEKNNFDKICSQCSKKDPADNNRECGLLHIDAVNKARQSGGSYIYICQQGFIFWTSPFYSGERFAGALLSGGVKKTEKNSAKIKSLAHIMLLCADQISKMSFVQKNIVWHLGNTDKKTMSVKIDHEKQKTEYISIDLERMLLASLRRGDNTEAQKILIKLLDALYLEVKKNFPAFRLKALELAVLLSRAVADPKDIIDNTALEATNRCVTKIEETSKPEEITEILQTITERMSGKVFSFHGLRHFSALRKAERYIWTHYTRKLTLREIADASGLSAPYFSTVFKEEMGENLSNYLNRLRVEKAAAMLVTTDLPISNIAKNCGFEDQSWFSKIFKNNTGFTPGKYRERGMASSGIYAEENILG